MGLIVKYSSEQRFVSFSENVSDRGNAISTVIRDSIRSVCCVSERHQSEHDHVLRSGRTTLMNRLASQLWSHGKHQLVTLLGVRGYGGLASRTMNSSMRLTVN